MTFWGIVAIIFFAILGTATGIEIYNTDAYMIDSAPFYMSDNVCGTSGIGMTDELVSFLDVATAK